MYFSKNKIQQANKFMEYLIETYDDPGLEVIRKICKPILSGKKKLKIEPGNSSKPKREMDLKLEFYKALCSTSIFEINGITADIYDFGTQDDLHPGDAEPHGCGNMTFERIPPTEKILNLYKISVDDYSTICDKLESGLSFGCCSWCV